MFVKKRVMLTTCTSMRGSVANPDLSYYLIGVIDTECGTGPDRPACTGERGRSKPGVAGQSPEWPVKARSGRLPKIDPEAVI